LTTASISLASFSISPRSLPKTLMPMGVRMPVDSMSVRLDRHRPGIGDAGELQRLVHFGDQLVGRHARPPFGLRLEVDDRLEHLGGRRVGGGVGAAGLAEDDSTSGKLLMILSWVCISSAALVIDMPGSEAGM
jgi:hypothetical protein